VSAPLDIQSRLDSSALQIRRQLVKQAFDRNAGVPESILTYLQEAYYFVPLHLAMQLQIAGHYVEALDWLRTIYDYEAPLDARKIYYGLETDAAPRTGNEYERVSDWLLDPLNPLRIASTRRYAYTRFTLFTLVRCLLDYADAE